MHARVATFGGGDPTQIREAIDQIEQRSESGPPEGVPAVSFLLLHRAEEGKVVSIMLFDTQADLEQGDATLNSMDPPVPGALGERTSVDTYEVGVKVETSRIGRADQGGVETTERDLPPPPGHSLGFQRRREVD